MSLHHRQQPEPLIQGRMDPYFPCCKQMYTIYGVILCHSSASLECWASSAYSSLSCKLEDIDWWWCAFTPICLQNISMSAPPLLTSLNCGGAQVQPNRPITSRSKQASVGRRQAPEGVWKLLSHAEHRCHTPNEIPWSPLGNLSLCLRLPAAPAE